MSVHIHILQFNMIRIVGGIVQGQRVHHFEIGIPRILQPAVLDLILFLKEGHGQLTVEHRFSVSPLLEDLIQKGLGGVRQGIQLFLGCVYIPVIVRCKQGKHRIDQNDQDHHCRRKSH